MALLFGQGKLPEGLPRFELLLEPRQDMGMKGVLGRHRLLRHLRQPLQTVLDDQQVGEDQFVLEFSVTAQDLGDVRRGEGVDDVEEPLGARRGSAGRRPRPSPRRRSRR